MTTLADRLRRKILDTLDLARDYSDEEIRDMIAAEVDQETWKKPVALSARIQLEEDIFNSLRRMDVLQSLLDDPDVTEILVNGPDVIFYEQKGRLYPYEKKFRSEASLTDMIQKIAGTYNRVVNQSSPIVDTRLADGSRVNIVLSPISVDGSAVSIRKFPKDPYQMEDLIAIGSIDPVAAEFLEILVRARYNIFISGGTGSGKTTFLNALSQYIPKDERIITIEDSAELQLLEATNLVRLETRNANLEGVNPISIRDLIKTALRMRPDRIIVGECRGEEALDMLSAMNTGHDGSLSTGHANSCRDILSRLETMVIMGKELPIAAVRSQIASGIDVIVQLGRLRDKSRRVLEIAEVDGLVDGEIRLHTIYRFKEERETKEAVADSSQDSKQIWDKNSVTRDDPKRVCGKLVLKGSLLHREKLFAAGMEEELPHGL